MAGGAYRIGRREMDGANAVTVQAALYDRLTHGHPRLAGQGVTPRAGWRFPSGLRDVSHMIEAKIAAARRRRRAPHDGFLDGPVVAGRARDGIGPERWSFLRRASVTRRARREQGFVLHVIESLRRLLQQRQDKETGWGDRRSARPP